MIKFFRKIRQKLLSEQRFSKYLLYALGEIILVVIGILIALQINTWNQERNTHILETKIIKEINNNLVQDQKEILDDLTYMEYINNACKYVKNHLQTQNKPSDTLYLQASVLRVTPHFDPNNSGYKLLQSKGVEVISNDSLRNEISLLYERTYPYYKRYEEERLRFHALHSESKLMEYFSMNFDLTSRWYGNFFITPEDYTNLKKDSSFTKLLAAIEFENSAVQNRGLRTARNIESLMKALQSELKNRTL
ncbi:MAG: hypothetical protein WAT79_10595 [Saprospiraceae bacterium]